MKISVLTLGLVFLFCVCEGKIYDRCKLAKELLNVHKLPRSQIATWVCIAHRESSYNTKAINKNSNGSRDHGLFQINDRYWCSPPGPHNDCKVNCNSLRDDNIADDVRCAKIIYKRHKFTAWTVYKKFCSGNNSKYIAGCGI